mmetsp:Transcript_4685/g.13891  ORF Transcript_4685/g.13891 Transcript_4685/m.13891 type:complete len:288 (-) Transcript_4685:744-1607(-)
MQRRPGRLHSRGQWEPRRLEGVGELLLLPLLFAFHFLCGTLDNANDSLVHSLPAGLLGEPRGLQCLGSRDAATRVALEALREEEESAVGERAGFACVGMDVPRVVALLRKPGTETLKPLRPLVRVFVPFPRGRRGAEARRGRRRLLPRRLWSLLHGHGSGPVAEPTLATQVLVFGPELGRGGGLPEAVEDAVELVVLTRAFKEDAPSHQLGEDAPRGPEVDGAVVVGGPEEHLGGAVVPRDDARGVGGAQVRWAILLLLSSDSAVRLEERSRCDGLGIHILTLRVPI